MEILLNPARFRSRGPFLDPPLKLPNKIMVGPGSFLTPIFVGMRQISHVINVSVSDAAPQWVQKSFGDRYSFIPCDDSIEFDLFARYPLFEGLVNSYLKDPTCTCIYVHCQAGMNRSATLAIAYVSRTTKMPLESLLRHSLHQRPCILMNPTFNEKLIAFTKNP